MFNFLEKDYENCCFHIFKHIAISVVKFISTNRRENNFILSIF